MDAEIGLMAIDTVVVSMGGVGSRIARDLKTRGVSASKTLLPIQGKSLLARLIDIYLELGFKNIYLLASYFEDDLKQFIAVNYEGRHEVKPIYGGSSGREWGVPWHIKQLSDSLPDIFIYSDGNILYEPNIVRDIAASEATDKSQAIIVVSQKDAAPTHSALSVSGGTILDINLRAPKLSSKEPAKAEGPYYSLGLMVLRKAIIEKVDGFSTMKDLDIVIESLYRADSRNVLAKVYTGDWWAIHTIQDFDELANTYKI